MDEEINALPFNGHKDRYGGVMVHSASERTSIHFFEKKLLVSLGNWKKDGKRGIWFKVSLPEAAWISVLAKNKFTFHHAQESYVMMIRWLPEDEECTIPKYAHTYIGVGAFVVNEHDQILVVKERYCYDIARWKLPGGHAEKGESLGSAAQREVLEETGISTTFASLLCFRHVHGVQFGCSDMYFICHLHPLNSEITMCQKELVDCKWMQIEDYISIPEITTVNRHIAKTYLKNKLKDATLTPINLKSSGKLQSIYCIEQWSTSGALPTPDSN